MNWMEGTTGPEYVDTIVRATGGQLLANVCPGA